MNHRERVWTTLNHQVPDRCPMQVSFTPEFAGRLKAHLGLSEAVQHNPHGGGNTYALERELDQDLLLTSVGWANSYYANEEYCLAATITRMSGEFDGRIPRIKRDLEAATTRR